MNELLISDGGDGDVSPEFVHPSQDFLLDLGLYVIPVLAKNVDDGSSEAFKTQYILVSSKREVIDLSDVRALFKAHKVHLLTRPSGLLVGRWNTAGIKAYCASSADVDPHTVFQAIRSILEKYIDFPEKEWYLILPLWIMGTYIFRVFEAFPYLLVTGFKGSGKSKLGDIVSRLAFNGLGTVGISEAALFRIVEATGSTLIIDEGEQLVDKHKLETMRQLLNGGYKRGIKVYRQEKQKGGNFETKSFDPYGPKVIVNIAGLESVLGSRAITVTMLRSSSDKGRKVVTDYSSAWESVRSDLYRFGLGFFSQVRVAYSYSPENHLGNNRDNELWSPILAIASVVLKDYPEEIQRIRSFGESQVEFSRVDTGIDPIALAIVFGMSSIVRVAGWYSNKIILDSAKPFLDLDEEHITNAKVGNALQRLAVLKRKRENAGIKYFISPEDVERLMDMFHLREKSSQPSPSSPMSEG